MTDEDQSFVQQVGLEYRDLLVAVAEAVPCTFDQAAGVVKRMYQLGFTWEKLEGD
ncbi:MAG: hypothetical protein OK436_05975 [Thaumarchaeota archaeon]|nr:hypothetical protein [Nitrososphaerota archaeon]